MNSLDFQIRNSFRIDIIGLFIALLGLILTAVILPFRVYQFRTDKWRSRRHLEELDERQLADIGVSREEANQESSKPFWTD
ncbi:MAG: DUF1127 domain-containing protein [Hyphomicrobiales bacterium]